MPLIIDHKSANMSMKHVFPGHCWGGGHREAGVLDHSAASDGEPVHGCSLWTASCCSAPVTGTCTCREMSTALLISRTRSLKDTCVSLPAGGWQTLLQEAPQTTSLESVHRLRLRQTTLRVEVTILIVSLEITI